jgi:U32 family peptidase
MPPLFKPQIVAPGGSVEKAQVAFAYGADAVYVGSQHFSLRKSADNFNLSQLQAICDYAAERHKSIYLALNIFPHERDVPNIITFLKTIAPLPLSALIISDLGMFTLAKTYTNIPIHVSTQASVLNSPAAQFWKDQGATRVVLAREASIKEAGTIQSNTGLETEVFIHGAMCSSFSGKCTISNVTSGRDSNRGGCIQSCRHNYQLSNGDALHIMNSKDLMGLAAIPLYFKHNITAVKIEGRMKSPLYLANAIQQYRTAIDTYATSPNTFASIQPTLQTNLERISNRGFTDASLVSPAAAASISYEWNGYSKNTEYMGIVKQSDTNKSLIQFKQPVASGDALTVLSPNNDLPPSKPLSIHLTLSTLDNTPLAKTQPNECVWADTSLPSHSILVRTHD